jgi:WD40 repeat protein
MAAKFDPDDRSILIATDEKIYQWVPATGSVELICTDYLEITDFAVDKTGGLIAWATKDQSVVILDRRSNSRKIFKDHGKWVQALAFSTDGKTFASVGDDAKIIVRRTSDWVVIGTVDAGSKDIWSIALSPDGQRLAAASIYGSVAVWGLENGAQHSPPTVLDIPPDKRWKVAFSGNGTSLGATSWHGTLSLFDAHTLEELGTIDGNDRRVNDIAFAQSRAEVITASESGAVKVWNFETLNPLFFDAHTRTGEVIVGAYSPDGKYFVAGGDSGIITVYKVGSVARLEWACEADMRDWVLGVAFTFDSSRVVAIRSADTFRADQPPIQVFRYETCARDPLIRVPFEGNVTTISASPTTPEIAWGNREGEVFFQSYSTMTSPYKVTVSKDVSVTAISFFHNQHKAVAATADGEIFLIDLRTFRFNKFASLGVYMGSVALSPDDRYVAVGGRDDFIYVWETEKLDSAPTRLAIPGKANNLSFNANGTMLAAGSDAAYAAMWSVHDGWAKVFHLESHKGLRSVVGVRSVYGFHPTRGDLAFDGEAGVVRILPNHVTKGEAIAFGVVEGVDVTFDVPKKEDMEEISSDWRFLNERICQK